MVTVETIPTCSVGRTAEPVRRRAEGSEGRAPRQAGRRSLGSLVGGRDVVVCIYIDATRRQGAARGGRSPGVSTTTTRRPPASCPAPAFPLRRRQRFPRAGSEPAASIVRYWRTHGPTTWRNDRELREVADDVDDQVRGVGVVVQRHLTAVPVSAITSSVCPVLGRC